MFAPYRPGKILFLLTRARENSTIPFFRHTHISGGGHLLGREMPGGRASKKEKKLSI